MSYNTDFWLSDQEGRGADNWEDATVNSPWYRCITQNNVKLDDRGKIYWSEFGTSLEMLEAIANYYTHIGYAVTIKMASRPGYLIAGCFAVMPYIGQWGRGWIIATPKNGSTVTLTYILVKSTGGDPDALAANYYE